MPLIFVMALTLIITRKSNQVIWLISLRNIGNLIRYDHQCFWDHASWEQQHEDRLISGSWGPIWIQSIRNRSCLLNMNERNHKAAREWIKKRIKKREIESHLSLAKYDDDAEGIAFYSDFIEAAKLALDIVRRYENKVKTPPSRRHRQASASSQWMRSP